MAMIFERKLPIPKEGKEQYSLSAELEKVVSKRAEEISNFLKGKSDRLALIIGPCSADNEDLVNLAESYSNSGLANPGVIVDTNHANSGKKYLEQIRITMEVLHSCRHDAAVKNLSKAL